MDTTTRIRKHIQRNKKIIHRKGHHIPQCNTRIKRKRNYKVNSAEGSNLYVFPSLRDKLRFFYSLTMIKRESEGKIDTLISQVEDMQNCLRFYLRKTVLQKNV